MFKNKLFIGLIGLLTIAYGAESRLFNQQELLYQYISIHPELQKHSTADYIKYDSIGDGNCLFNALGIARQKFIADIQNEDMLPTKSKAEIEEYLLTRDFFSLSEEIMPDFSPGEHMSTLRAIAMLYHLNISVLVSSKDGPFYIQIQDYQYLEGGKYIYLLFKPCHFDLLVPNIDGYKDEHQRGAVLQENYNAWIKKMTETSCPSDEELLAAGVSQEEINASRKK